MLAEIPIVSPAFQFLLNGIGWILAEIYRFVPNYGVAIIVLTLLIRFVLLPLGIKQIKSMQAMQAIQPRVKEIQKKYKGDKQKAQEETMKLYREAGVNPLGGCLPLLLQFPILIAMYAVIRAPLLQPTDGQSPPSTYTVANNHLPVDSQLFADVIQHEHTSLLIVNLQCSAGQSGTTADLSDTSKAPVNPGVPLVDGRTGAPLPNFTSRGSLDCGNGIPSKIPYFALLLLMIGTTFYQQRQMQKASPPGAASQQQQAILKIMPIMFGIFGFQFPAGLVLYWTTSNLFQIGQQAFLLRAGHIGPEALERRIAEQRASANDRPAKKGFIAQMMERAQQAQQGQGGTAGGARGVAKAGPGESGPSRQHPPSGPRRKPNTGSTQPRKGGPKKRPGGSTSGS